jgi:hypothetical protein
MAFRLRDVVVLILQNAISEYLNEFGVKYNFIVNYLVYTNEVIGIIMSYPVVPLFFRTYNAGIVTYFFTKRFMKYIDSILLLLKKLKYRDYILFCLDCL